MTDAVSPRQTTIAAYLSGELSTWPNQPLNCFHVKTVALIFYIACLVFLVRLPFRTDDMPTV